ncbi:hypothetical protein M758_1G304700 [Ceratodon purpureus]|nr:hypothetical protein M758_1G304700 [Ceratodon purpureus]
MMNTCSACGSPASIASSRLLCPSSSISSPSLATYKFPRNPRVLGLGFSCADYVLREISCRASLPLGILCRTVLGTRGVFAENQTKAIGVVRGENACASTNKSRNVRAAARVVRDHTSPLSSTDSQHHENEDEVAERTVSIPSESSELIAGADIVGEEAVAEVLVEHDDGSALRARGNTNSVQQEMVEELRLGRSPIEILESMIDWSPPAFWAVVDYLHANGRMAGALEVFKWWKRQDGYRPCELHYTRFIRMLGQAHMSTDARLLFVEMCELGLRPSVATYTCLLQSYAERGLFDEAELILRDMVLSGDAKPNTITYTGLIHAYGKHGMYDSMWRTFNSMKTYRIPADEFTYRTLIKAYAQGGLFSRMQLTIKEMSRNGMYADSATMNAVVLAYAEAGLVKEMEKHYEILTKYSFIPGEKTVKAIVWTYVKNSLFFQLSGFVKRVGLKRKTMGNYLWNAFLLSRAANFAMKDLRVEFENMKDAGFYPDVTTCNIMILAYSRMKQFWELHEFIITMQNNGIAPDLVTYGAVIDVFIEEKLRPKLLEELVEFRNLDVVAEVETDPVVFEVFRKGRFHVACETLARNMEGQAKDQRTYSELIGHFLQSLNKPKYSRRNSSQ